MTRLECITAAMLALARNGLTVDEGMILTQALSRFNGVTTHQIGKIIGRTLPACAMKNLALRKLVVGEKINRRRHWSITIKGTIVIAEMLGEVKEPA